MNYSQNNYWALILGGSSGFGLASAKKLSAQGVNICIVHRDRRGSIEKIESEFEKIRNNKVRLVTFNLDALSDEGRNESLVSLKKEMGKEGKLRLLMHSIAFGNLKPLVPVNGNHLAQQTEALHQLASSLGTDVNRVRTAVNSLFASGKAEFLHLADPPLHDPDFSLNEEDIANTIYAMGVSIFSWVRDAFNMDLFAEDARVIGLTSEGNEVAWRGYAAVSAAKVALESISRSIALEFAPRLKSNILQPGVTDTPALRLIPGNMHMLAAKKLSNPMGRTTTPEDVANVVALLITDEAAWINGEVIRVDGGERIAG